MAEEPNVFRLHSAGYRIEDDALLGLHVIWKKLIEPFELNRSSHRKNRVHAALPSTERPPRPVAFIHP